MTNPKSKPIVPKAPTEQEIHDQRVRVIAQKRESFAQMVLAQLCQALPSTVISEPEALAKAAVKQAEAFLEALYNIGEK